VIPSTTDDDNATFVAAAIAMLASEPVRSPALLPSALWTAGRRRARRRTVVGVAACVVAAVALGSSSFAFLSRDPQADVAANVSPARAADDVGALLAPSWKLSSPPYYSETADPLPSGAPSPKFGPCDSFTSLSFTSIAPRYEAPDTSYPRPVPAINVWITECGAPGSLTFAEAATVAAEATDGPDGLRQVADEAVGDGAHLWVYTSADPADDARLVGTLWTNTGLLVTVNQHGEPARPGALTGATTAKLLAELARRWTPAQP
jgi:hypothetical protein